MTETEKIYSRKYKECRDVAKKDCYMGGHNCGTCMHCRSYDSHFNKFKHEYCTCTPITNPG